jgi:hypothetical protein
MTALGVRQSVQRLATNDDANADAGADGDVAHRVDITEQAEQYEQQHTVI